jgi:hypothetical protein
MKYAERRGVNIGFRYLLIMLCIINYMLYSKNLTLTNVNHQPFALLSRVQKAVTG